MEIQEQREHGWKGAWLIKLLPQAKLHSNSLWIAQNETPNEKFDSSFLYAF